MIDWVFVMPDHILVLGQNPFLQQLNTAEYTPLHAATPQELLSLAAEYDPVLIILDVEGQELSAPTLCKYLRQHTQIGQKPFLLLTAPIPAELAAELLDAGADDLLRKPMGAEMLLARVRALHRFANRLEYTRPLLLTLHAREHTIEVESRQVALTPVEFQVFSFLCQNQSCFYTAEQLLQLLWGYPQGTGDTALVRNHIRNLRRKLEHDPDHPRILIARYGQGYAVRAIVQES